MDYTTATYSPRTCRRCKGTGYVNNPFLGGRCFGCQGSGSEMVESGTRPCTDAEVAKIREFEAGVAAREARAAARAARKAERETIGGS